MKFRMSDIANLDEAMSYAEPGSYNCYNVHPFIIHDHGTVITVVFASNLQDALDTAVDENKFDNYLVKPEDYADYGVETDEPTCTFLGNASEPFDIECLDVVEMTIDDFRKQLQETAEFSVGQQV